MTALRERDPRESSIRDRMILERIEPRVVGAGADAGATAEWASFAGSGPASASDVSPLWLRLDRLYPEEIAVLSGALGHSGVVRTSNDPRTGESRVLVSAVRSELGRAADRLADHPDGGELAFAVRRVLADRAREPRRLRIARGGGVDLGRPVAMGILNVTPDSFSDGGKWLDPRAAVAHGLALASAGAGIVDVGGQSTRPGAEEVGEAEEIARVLPVVEALVASPGFTTPISIDTSRSEVARRTLAAGASIVNDVTGLSGDPGMAEVVAASGAGLVVMHIQGTPRTMQDDPKYEDLMGEVTAVLREAIHVAELAGVDPEAIAVDPGIGFGKTLGHNLEILRRLGELRSLGRPIAVGTSRKSFLGRLTGRAPDARAFGTAASVALAVAGGASIVRVHDVAEMVDVVAVAAAILGGPT